MSLVRDPLDPLEKKMTRGKRFEEAGKSQVFRDAPILQPFHLLLTAVDEEIALPLTVRLSQTPNASFSFHTPLGSACSRSDFSAALRSPTGAKKHTLDEDESEIIAISSNEGTSLLQWQAAEVSGRFILRDCKGGVGLSVHQTMRVTVSDF